MRDASSPSEGPCFEDVTRDFLDAPLRAAVLAVIDEQRARGASGFRPAPDAEERVSETVLDQLLSAGDMVSDIVVSREISNCVAYNFDNVTGAVMDAGLAAVRRSVDGQVRARLATCFHHAERLAAENTGHFWYPPGGFMSWHTNLRTPGWRLYISHSADPGRSFFRYRDPATGHMVTDLDRAWNVRLFAIDPARPFWHAVYSETDRFSLGYKIYPL